MFKQRAIRFDDREILCDALQIQKQAARNYTLCLGDCMEQRMRDEFVQILCEEHAIHGELYSEMAKRGWQMPEPADQTEIDRIKEKYRLQA